MSVPPPPSPTAPPGPPGVEPTVVHSVFITMMAAGAVSDYDANKRAEIAAVFAQAANLTLSDVAVAVTAGSVIVSAKI
eukprot:4144803-Prymnesium_polylepis.1